MMLTVRLSERDEKTLSRLARMLGTTRSAAIRAALLHLAAARGLDEGATALDRLKPYVGVFRSASGDLSASGGQRARRLAREKHARRSR